jgi:hypothetical protein
MGPLQMHVYCDESQTSGVRFTVYGGIVIPATSVPVFDEVMQEWRKTTHMFHEIAWEKVSKSYLDGFKSLVDLAFDHIAQEHFDFKAVVFDSHDRRYVRGDKEQGFYKLYYQFLLKKFVPYAMSDDHRLYVYIDERTTKYKLSTLHAVLNNGIRATTARTGEIVKKVEPRNSKECNLIQVADLLMGAIGYQCNGLDKRLEAARHKVELARYIAEKAGVKTLTENIWGRPEFEIWRFKSKAAMQKGKERPSP